MPGGWWCRGGTGGRAGSLVAAVRWAGRGGGVGASVALLGVRKWLGCGRQMGEPEEDWTARHARASFG